MKERAEAMVLASFVADSHALGVHWIYDMDEIASRYGRVDRLLPPAHGSFHAGRPVGAHTHYGDQTLLLLRHLASHRGFEAEAFSREWQEAMQSYDGYLDTATKETLENLRAGRAPTGAGSGSHDLSAAGRIAPLAYLYRDDRDGLVQTAGVQASITHGAPEVPETAAFLAGVLWIVLNGKTPTSAIALVTRSDPESRVSELVRKGMDSVGRDTREAALEFGQGCSVGSALPLAIHLIAKYEGSLRDALVENVAAGGDSAARGMVVGMVLGAFHGRDAIPDRWIQDLRSYRETCMLLEDLEAALQRSWNGAVEAG